jgi:hypothetical protein
MRSSWGWCLVLIAIAGHAGEADPDPTFGILGNGSSPSITGASVAPSGSSLIARPRVHAQPPPTLLGDPTVLLDIKVQSNSTQGLLLARFTSLGALDSGFGSGGLRYVETAMVPRHSAYATWTATSGPVQSLVQRLFVIGEFRAQPPNRIVVCSLTRNGVFDANFPGGGCTNLVFTDFGATDTGAALDVTSDGSSIYVAGHWVEGGQQFIVGIVRMDGTTGAIDPNFGTSGVARFGFGSFNAVGATLHVDTQGRLLVQARLLGAAEEGLGVLRVLPSGALDTRFCASGCANTAGSFRQFLTPQTFGLPLSIGRPAATSSARNRLAIAVGDSVVQLDSAGRLDLNFGVNGRAVLPDFDTIGLRYLHAGSVLLAGERLSSTFAAIGKLSRTARSCDISFSSTCIVTPNMTVGFSDVTIDGASRPLYARIGSNDYSVVRFQPNGDLFGDGFEN